jgi:hypothetical protein
VITPRRNWSIHWCLLDKECRQYGAGTRIEFNVPGWHGGIALLPGDRYCQYYRKGRWHDFEPQRWWQGWISIWPFDRSEIPDG